MSDSLLCSCSVLALSAWWVIWCWALSQILPKAAKRSYFFACCLEPLALVCSQFCQAQQHFSCAYCWLRHFLAVPLRYCSARFVPLRQNTALPMPHRLTPWFVRFTR